MAFNFFQKKKRNENIRNMLIVLFANYAMSQNILRKNHTKLNNNFPFHRTSVRDSIEIAQILVACLNDGYIL